jgi:integrase
MGLYKRCEHKDTKAENDCSHDWWGQFMFGGTNYRTNLVKWSGEKLDGRKKADAVYERMRAAVRAGTFREGERECQPGAGAGHLAVPAAAASEATAIPRGRVRVEAFAADFVTRHIKFEGHTTGERIVEYFVEAFGPRLVDTITTDEIRDLITKFKQPYVPTNRKKKITRSDGRMDRIICGWRSMINWGVSEGYLLRSPFKSIVTGKPVIKETKAENKIEVRVSEDELDVIRCHVHDYVADLIDAAVDTGMRHSERMALQVGDLDARPGWIRCRRETVKGTRRSSKPRDIPIATTRLAKLLNKWRKDASGRAKGGEELLFSFDGTTELPGYYANWKTGCEKAGRPKLREHDLRHECASRLVESGMPLPEVQKILGHKRIETTMRYLSVLEDKLVQNMRKLQGYTGEGEGNGPRPSTNSTGNGQKDRRGLRIVPPASEA